MMQEVSLNCCFPLSTLLISNNKMNFIQQFFPVNQSGLTRYLSLFIPVQLYPIIAFSGEWLGWV
jgi:hypothetical protein